MFDFVAVTLPRYSVPQSPALNALGAGEGGSQGTRDSDVVATTLASRTCGVASPQVLASGDRFKVARVDAVPHPAQVIQVNGPVQWRPEPLVKGSVRQLSSVQPSAELPITVSVTRPIPQPAAGVGHGVSAPVVHQGASCHTSGQVPAVVLLAHTASKSSRDALVITDSAHRIHPYTLPQGGDVR